MAEGRDPIDAEREVEHELVENLLMEDQIHSEETPESVTETNEDRRRSFEEDDDLGFSSDNDAIHASQRRRDVQDSDPLEEEDIAPLADRLESPDSDLDRSEARLVELPGRDEPPEDVPEAERGELPVADLIEALGDALELDRVESPGIDQDESPEADMDRADALEFGLAEGPVVALEASRIESPTLAEMPEDDRNRVVAPEANPGLAEVNAARNVVVEGDLVESDSDESPEVDPGYLPEADRAGAEFPRDDLADVPEADRSRRDLIAMLHALNLEREPRNH